VDILILAIIIVAGIIALVAVGKFLGGCLLRLLLFAVIIAIIAYLVYRFVW